MSSSGCQIFPKYAVLGGEHCLENVKELAAFFHKDREVEAGDPDRHGRQNHQNQNHQRRAAALFFDDGPVGKPVAPGAEDAVIQAHTAASDAMSSP